MIRCSHCGKLAPQGALSCQHCGMPLANGGTGATSGGQAEQQELPAWLESLRAHERPVASNQENRQPFSLDELVDEDSMPSWMRQDRRKMPESGNSDSFPALPAMPASGGPERQDVPASGFQAGSLIDERSLPAWMRENQAQSGGQAGAAVNVSAHSLVDQQNLPAWIKDLSQSAPAVTPPASPAVTPPRNQYGLPPVQTPMTPPTMPGAPSVPQTPPANNPSATFGQGFSAHDLIDVQAMPSWMSGSQGPGQGQGQGPGAPPTRPVPVEQGFSAGELIDQRSIPQWMKELQGQEKATPQSAMGVPVNGSGQMTGTTSKGQGTQGTTSNEGMPAGSLLDTNSMPPWLQESQLSSSQTGNQGFSASSLLDSSAAPAWMREGLQGNIQTPQAGNQGFSASSLLDAGSAPAWMRENAQQAGPQEAQQTGAGFSANSLLDMGSMPAWMREGEQASAQGAQTAGGMPAGSLIDMNAMPAWLRNAETNQGGPAGRPGQVSARPVPSRPRHEGAPVEQSEAAANVFASMLGVAASAPALPGQEPAPGLVPGAHLGVAQNLQGSQGLQGQPMPSLPPFQQAQPSLPGWQQPDMAQYNQGAQARSWQMSGPMPALGGQAAPNAYAPGGQHAGPQEMPPRLNNPELPAWNNNYAADRTALGVTSNADAGHHRFEPQSAGTQNTPTKKKGIFDSIREFFTR